MRVCDYDGCDNKHYGRGWCTGHYQQWSKGGPMRGLDSVPLSFRNEAGEKRCPGCADWLPETSFGANKAMPDGLANRCKDCAWSAGIWSKYRITGERYRGLLDQQDGACALCLSPAKDGRLAVDHDHNCCPGARSCGKCV